eukprot:scaffold153482_cov27-Prasinocladus_malaysianus.AAC.1
MQWANTTTCRCYPLLSLLEGLGPWRSEAAAWPQHHTHGTSAVPPEAPACPSTSSSAFARPQQVCLGMQTSLASGQQEAAAEPGCAGNTDAADDAGTAAGTGTVGGTGTICGVRTTVPVLYQYSQNPP